MSRMLTFELNPSQTIEVHVNEEGLQDLIEVLRRLNASPSSEHVHLMTASWGGSELTENTQGVDTQLVHRVTFHLWR